MGLNLFMTLATACFGLVAMVAGIFGMNLDPLPISSTQANPTAAASPLISACCLHADAIYVSFWHRVHGCGAANSHCIALQAAFWIVIACSLFLALFLALAVTSLAWNRRLLFIPKLQFALRAGGPRSLMDPI